MKQAKAYTLIEMLMFLSALVILFSFSGKAMFTLSREIPMADRSFNTQISTNKALERLCEDIEKAVSLEASSDNKSDEFAFTLTTGQESVEYKLCPGAIFYGPAGDPNTFKMHPINLPDVKFQCRVIYEQQTPSALEIVTWQQRKFLGKEVINFRQANVFFVGLWQKEDYNE